MLSFFFKRLISLTTFFSHVCALRLHLIGHKTQTCETTVTTGTDFLTTDLFNGHKTQTCGQRRHNLLLWMCPIGFSPPNWALLQSNPEKEKLQRGLPSCLTMMSSLHRSGGKGAARDFILVRYSMAYVRWKVLLFSVIPWWITLIFLLTKTIDYGGVAGTATFFRKGGATKREVRD